MKYKHVLFLYPYPAKAVTDTMMLFPPTGLEYVATSAKKYVGKVTLLDLRYEKDLSNIKNLLDFIQREKIDIIGVSIGWNRYLKEFLNLVKKIPKNIFGIFGYAIDPETKICYHRCFEPRTTQELLSEYLNEEAWKVTLEDLTQA